MYNGKLRADPSVAYRRARDIAPESEDEVVDWPLMFIDTAGALVAEGVDEESKSESKYN